MALDVTSAAPLQGGSVSTLTGPQLADLSQTGFPESIHENFEAQVARSPNAIALTFGSEQLTYAQLNNRSGSLARQLRGMGVGPETPVALYLERSIEMVVAILAVLKAGGAYVPIDLAYPHERISFMLEDTAAPVLLTQRALLKALPPTSAAVICLDDLPAISPAQAPDFLSGIGGHNAAYIIYTSGSTGKPKGVIVTHRNVVRLFRSTQHWFHFNSSDVWPLFHSYSFDMSVWELWGSLFYGGRLVVVPHAIARSPQDFYALLSREKVTFLNQTPSAFRQLIWVDATAPQPLKLHLRHVTCGGEALELQSLRPWFDRHGDQQPVIVNMYGITETTVHTTYRPISRADLDSGAGSVFGVPIPDLHVYLVDENLKPVPHGVPGEICVGGAGVARGYLNRPELNALRFVPDPFAADGSTMYRSGDLAQVNAFGEMEYLGRIDHQVKIRGFRVELGEIESALNRHPAIRESVVLARGDGSDKRLVGYFVPVAEAPGTSELRACLAPILPEYMLPSVFVAMKSFPLTNNGKIDRRALPEPGAARPELSTSFVAPGTEAEQQLAAVWEEVLGVAPVGVNDSFFDLGGDSIRAIVLLSKATKRGLSYTIQELFETPSVAGLAARKRAADPAAPPGSAAPFSLICPEDRVRMPEGVQDAYPIAALQLGMFFHNELDPLSAMYHDVFSYEVSAPFDPAALERAAQNLIERHPMLRTSFHLGEFSCPLQLVHSQVNVPFSWEDNRELQAGARGEAILNWIEAEKRRAFKRDVPPLMRFHAQRQKDNVFQLFVSFHHSCTDGWSLAVVVTEVLREYAALLGGRSSGIPGLPLGYRDFIALEQAGLASEADRRFWLEHLAGASPAVLPRWPKKTRRGGHEQVRGPEIHIAEPLIEGLKKLARRAGTPLKTVLLAAHVRVVSHFSGHKDVVTGLVSNGRPELAEADRLVGLFLNTVPIRQRLAPGTWTDFVRQTFASERAILPHRRFPLAEAQKLHGHTVLETAFDFVHFHVLNELRACDNLTFSEGPYFESNNLAAYTTFILDPSGKHLELHIDFDPNEIAPQQIDQMDFCYLRTLQAMASNPDGDWKVESIMPPEEQRRILVEWNQTSEAYDQSATLHQLFEQRAAAQPDAPAVECDGTIVSYSELNRQADEIAGLLVAYGVKPGALVGLCVERHPPMVAAMLGILKAGAAYVPLDPAFPKERLDTIAADAELKVILADGRSAEVSSGCGARIILVDSRVHETRPLQKPTVDSGSLAYVIYTSGSTGKPKGVQIEHRSVVNLLLSAAGKLNVSAADRLLAVTTISFDIAGLELFMPLLTGATVVIATRETTTDGPALAELLDKSGATIMQGTPSTWRMLLEAGWKGSPGLKIICGGEALPALLASQLQSLCCELWNFYGPTETTIWSTAERVADTLPVTIGRPLANTQAYILNADLEPAPIGAIGELLLGGHGVARGYWNRPELTAEKFIPHPFELGQRLYRTGDLARFLPDGRMECLGRLDHQVKVRGFRIELGDIESALGQHEGIERAVVTALRDHFGEQRLAAYVVSRNGSLATKELRSYLGGKLPAYMIPAYFVQLQQLPLTPNGKVDLKQLPAPAEAAERMEPFVPPTGDTEIRLSEIWQEVLGVPRVGAQDDFFDLGADSLSATRAFARINTTLCAITTLRDIFENPTVRSLAASIARTQKLTARSAIKRQPRTGK